MRRTKLSELSSWKVRRQWLNKVRLNEFGSSNMFYPFASDQ